MFVLKKDGLFHNLINLDIPVASTHKYGDPSPDNRWPNSCLFEGNEYWGSRATPSEVDRFVSDGYPYNPLVHYKFRSDRMRDSIHKAWKLETI